MNTNKKYHPFGTEMQGRSFSSPSYRYGFNGKEKDDEVKGNGNSYDFGARMLDVRLGRWLTIDPMWRAYPMLSPYVMVGNSPLSSIDHEGELIIFVNGFARGGIRLVPLIVGAPKPGGTYWSDVFKNKAKSYYNDKNVSFANGSGLLGISTAQMRRMRGVRFAKKQLEKALNGEPSIFSDEHGKPIVKKLENGQLEWSETIKVVSHSHGGAFGAGIIDYVQSKGATVEEVVNIAPHGHFDAPEAPNTVQVNVKGDPVSAFSGEGRAEKGTDLNVTKKAEEFYHEPKIKRRFRHYSPLGYYPDHEKKQYDNDTFKFIEEAKKQKAAQEKKPEDK